jgi:hypothetical protein
MDDVALLCAFEDDTIDPELMSHENHVRLAFLLLRACPLTVAMVRYRAGLLKLTSRIAKPQKYHETITLALMMLIHERDVAAYPDYPAFAASNRDLIDDWKRLLLSHYNAELLFSDAARLRFHFPRPLA